MLPIGSLAPHFAGNDQHGQRLSLSELLGRGKLVLYFYPRDFTPVCSAQACMFRDAAAELAELGTNVVGVSPDPVERHAQFSGRHELGFTLIADPEQQIARDYDARAILGMIKRVTYVIDVDRKILGAFQHQFSASKHLSDVRALLKHRA